MPIVQQGSINTTALIVPDIYVQIVPPQNLVLNGVPTDTVGVVGTASWGPVNQPAIIGNMGMYANTFGPVVARKFDMGTQVATAVQQGAQNFRCVRVTDGTDAAATIVVPTNALTLTALFTGTAGNSTTVSIAVGRAASSWALVVSNSVLGIYERFDNLTGTGNALWVAAAAAINNGQGVLRPPSLLVRAAAGAGTTAASAATYTLTGGADGTTTITAAVLVGADTLPRTGMYALRGQGCSIGVLADADDSTQWTTQAQFGLSEGLYMICCGPAGDTITNAISVKATAGVDSYAVKLLFGDWILWNDQVNKSQRLVSPQGFEAGRLANLSPEQSSLNKPMYSIVGTQKSAAGIVNSAVAGVYSEAELQALFQAGIDVICNPQPGGTYFGARLGHNSSSNLAVNGDNYTRMTNYIAATLAAGMGLFVGEVINATLFRRVRSTLLNFLSNMLQQGQLGTLDGSLPYGVVCDLSNNPFSRTSLGYLQADVQVQYQAINEKFIVNLEGGQTVTINRQTLPSGQPAS